MPGKPIRRRPLLKGPVALLTCCAFLASATAAAVPAFAGAAEITVTGTDDEISDNGVCSLREAIIAADTDTASQSCSGGSGADTVVVPAGRYRLFIPGIEDGGGAFGSLAQIKDLDVTDELTIQGAGQDSTIIDANEVDRALDVYAPTTIADLSVVNGRPQETGAYTYNAGNGGGIRASAPLTIVRCLLADNRAAAGLNGASKTGNAGDPLTFGEFGRDGGDGGAVYAEASLTVIDSRFESNAAGAGGNGGNSTGGPAPNGGAKSEANGGSAIGGFGGSGGDGGAIWARAGVSVTGTIFEDNGSGSGGAGGSASGAAAGGYFNGGRLEAGNNGGTLGGQGGVGGSGGALFVTTGGFVASGDVDVSGSYFVGNGGGTGGTGGSGVGPRGEIFFIISPGGNASGGAGGPGGPGGAIATAAGTRVLALSNATFNGNVGGTGGTGGAAKGGDPASFEGSQTAPGEAFAGTGGAGGAGGGGAFRGGARLTNVTAQGNRSGSGGNGGAATPPVGFPNFRANGGTGGAGGSGGAIANLEGNTQTEVRSSTLTGNAVGAGGGGGSGRANGPAGGAGSGQTLAIPAGRISLGASILEGPGPACSGTIEDHGGNLNRNRLGGEKSCPGEPGDAGLGELTDNGGPVPTRRPDPLGPAIDRAPAADCPATDARFVDRPSGAGCDIGAYEVAPPDAATGDATDIDASGGTLTAVVNPQAAGGVVHFEYGTTSGYGSRTPDQALDPAAEELGVSAPVTGFGLGTVVHYRVSITTPDGSAIGADRTFTTGRSAAELQAEAAAAAAKAAAEKAAADKAAAERAPPRLSGVSIGAKRFAVSDKPTAVALLKTDPTAAGSRRPHVPKGTSFRLTSSKAATVTFAIARRTVIHRHGKKKVRFRSAGDLKRALGAGPSSTPFSGRIGHKALKPGRYRAQITAVDGLGNRSNTATLEFTVVHG